MHGNIMKQKFIILFFLPVILFLPNISRGQDTNDSATDTTSVQKKPQPIDVVDINFELERTKKKLDKISYKLEPKPQFHRMDSLLNLQEAFFDNEVKEFKQFNPNNLSKFFLENTYRAWSGYKSKLETWKTMVNSYVSDIQNDIDELGKTYMVWKLTREKAIDAKYPGELITRITKIMRETENLERKFMKYRSRMIVREDKISELISTADKIQEEVAQLQQHLRDNLFVSDKPALWNVKYSKSDIIPIKPKLKKAWHENAKTVHNFSKGFSYLTLAIVTILIILFYLFIIGKFRRLDLTEADPNYVTVKRILIDHPYSALLFILLILIIVVYTNIPLILNGLLGLILLFFSLKFLPRIIGKKGEAIVKAVMVLYILNLGEIIFWYFGNYARLYITAESLIAIFLIYKYGLGSFNKLREHEAPFVKTFRILSIVLLFLFIVAFFSNLFGFLNLAVLTLKIGVKTAAILVIIFSAYTVLRTIIIALFEIGRSSNIRIMAGRWDLFQKRTIQLLNILAFMYLLKFVLQTMEIYRPLMDWLQGFLGSEWVISDSLKLSLGGILGMILIFVVTFAVANMVRVIFEDEVFTHVKLPKGVPAAISVTIRYFIITLGVIIALGVAGVDLGKFGLLAGALGVGIGFGLQNIVNNFISGLILVYERPVNVGDTIEVENLMGTVNRIGIRSSNVRTYDGAEVVVPNGNLISNQLINWTLSDNKRRIEIKVGVAYGSDPNVVLKLIKQVAMEHEDVMKDPEPRALFEEFGDSSLNFRLLFWVPFEKGIGAKSDISIGIYNIFAENGIEIPFPQVDLHVKEEQKKDKETPVSEPKPKSKTKTEKSKASGPIEEPELGNDHETGPVK